MEIHDQYRTRNVVISGLTAAGKTTHARILQAEYGFAYVSASTILREKAGIHGQIPNDFWLSSRGQQLVADMDKYGVDETIQQFVETRDEQVFDCRTLPWLAPKPVFSIWLESSLESRVMKSIVSHEANERGSADVVRAGIASKDQSDHQKLLATFGFDLLVDHQLFDVVLDISQYISTPTREASWRSIRSVQDILSAIVGLFLTNDEYFRSRTKTLYDKLGSTTFVQLSPYVQELLDGRKLI